MGTVKWGEMVEEFDDDDFVEPIEPSSSTQLICLVETHREDKELKASEKLIEFNFSRCSVSKKGHYNQLLINNGLPRFEICDLKESLLDLKKRIFNRIRIIFKTPKDGEFNDAWINKNIIF